MRTFAAAAILLLAWQGETEGQIVEISTDNVIHGDRGIWGKAEYCPDESYVSGFELKVQESQKRGDNTALNGLRLHCRSLYSVNNPVTATITSTLQKWGSWKGLHQCWGNFVHGYRQKIEVPQESGDNTGANSMSMRCQDGQELKGAGSPWGTWSAWSNCPAQYAVCGVSTRVEGTQGRGDDTALNAARLLCCPFNSSH